MGPGDRVALYLQNVPQFVVALLAIWKLGAVAVPINPMLREREVAYLLADSEATALICLQELWHAVAAKVVENSGVTVSVTTSPLDGLDPVPAPLASVQRIDTPGAHDFRSLLQRYAGRRPPPFTADPDGVAILTYTSGTTGEPKGAMNTHRNVAFNAQVFRDWMGLARPTFAWPVRRCSTSPGWSATSRWRCSPPCRWCSATGSNRRP